MNNQIIILIFILLYSSLAHSLDADSLGRGGTYLTDSSMTQGLLFSPSNLKRKDLSLDLSVSLNGSEKFFDLIQENTDIESDYERRLSPYFGSAIRAEVQGGFGINYKGYTFFPYLLYVEGNALLNDPAYPYANVALTENKGFGFGYGGSYKKWVYGMSAAQFITKKREFIANVLNYKELSSEIESFKSSRTIAASLGYRPHKRITLMSNYQYKDFLEKITSFNVGSKISVNKLDFLVELHELERFDFFHSFHGGVDWNVWRFVTLKIGSNQGYLTYGSSFNFGYFRINASSSGHNQFENYRHEYRNYALDLSFGYNL